MISIIKGSSQSIRGCHYLGKYSETTVAPLPFLSSSEGHLKSSTYFRNKVHLEAILLLLNLMHFQQRKQLNPFYCRKDGHSSNQVRIAKPSKSQVTVFPVLEDSTIQSFTLMSTSVIPSHSILYLLFLF